MQELYDIIENIDLIQINQDEEYKNQLFRTVIEVKDAFIHSNQESYHLCQIEIDVLSFCIFSNQVSYAFTNTRTNGQPFFYPDLSTFTENDFEYLKNRLSKTINRYLISRYSFILWYKTKRQDYGLIASNSYAEIAKKFNDLQSSDDAILWQIKETIEIAILIAANFKKTSDYERIKTDFLLIVRDYSKFENTFVSKFLIYFMLKHTNVFKKNDLIGLEQLIYQLAQKYDREVKIGLLEIGQRVDVKLGKNNTVWDEEIAQCYEDICYAGENSPFYTEAAQNAIKYYKKLKNTIKVEELSKRYKYLKDSLVLDNSHHQKIDITQTLKYIQGLTNYLCKEANAEEMFRYLMYNKDIIPEYQVIEQWATQTRNKYPASYYIANIKPLDHNKHHSERFETSEEKIRYSNLQHFGWSLYLYTNQFLCHFFYETIIRGKVSANIVFDFLQQHSWLGQNIRRQNQLYNWLNLIMPAINDYFSQLSFYYLNRLNVINLTLCIDSLVLKIEGILRDICDLRGGVTFFTNKEGISQEKDINALLHDDTIVNVISKDDIFFFSFLLVEKTGYNLRNDVAHALLRSPQQYSIDHMNLLILAVLKLAKNEYAPVDNPHNPHEPNTHKPQ